MSRVAITLLEVAIVLIVIVILGALFLPAIQSARDSSRRSAQVFERRAASAGAAMASSGELAPADKASAVSSGNSATVSTGADRKIIYSATVDLAVENFADTSERVVALVKQFDGYVAGSNLSGSKGESRQGTWKIRVPVARFEDFVKAAKGLGELVNAGTSSKDVSEEYYDVDARIRNKTKEEERLLKLLEERPGKLEDVIAIERELSRVREELERIQGRMRVLTDLTSLTTVDLTITEIHNYQPEDAATLSTRVRRAFDGSLSALESTGANAVIVSAAIVPWLPVIGVCLGALYLIVRAQRGGFNLRTPPKDQTPLSTS